MSMSADGRSPNARLKSELLDEDVSYFELVQEFVETLPGRLNEITAAYDSHDLALMKTLAHRLKGAGGSFGYPQITKVAADLEAAIKQGRTEHFESWLSQLDELQNAARLGLSDYPQP